MANDRRTYQFGESRLTLEFGTITTSKAQALVSSDDYYLSMGGGVSAALLRAGGPAIARHAAKLVPLAVGDVAVTTAGDLPARYLFHAVTRGPGGRAAPVTPAAIVERATARCIDLLDALGLSSIAFPAIGTGVAGFSLEDAAVEMAKVLGGRLTARAAPAEVTVYLFDRSGERGPMDYVRFFEEFARRLPDLPSAVVDERGRRPRARQGQDERRVRVFYAYAPEDERWRQQLEESLAPLRDAGLIEEWHDRMLSAGEERAVAIDTHLEAAELVLLLVSSHFFSSDYDHDQAMARLIQKQHAGRARVIPIIVRDCDWEAAPFAKLTALPQTPKKAVRAVLSWPNRDTAWTNVARGIRAAVQELRAGAGS
jgi:O-acetyl-ADP-ribose deacetylase (regulator of RNase III)